MPLRSLRSRLVLIFLVSLTTTALAVTYVAVRQFDEYQRNRAPKALKQSAGAVAKFLEYRQQSELGTFGKLQRFVPLLKELAGGRTRILLAKHGDLDFGTAPLPPGLEQLPDTYVPEIRWRQPAAPSRPAAVQPRPRRQALRGRRRGRLHPRQVAAAALPQSRRSCWPRRRAASTRRRSRCSSSSCRCSRWPCSPSCWSPCSSAGAWRGRCASWPLASEQIAEGLYDVQLRSKGATSWACSPRASRSWRAS